MNIQKTAKSLAQSFVTKQRDNGESFVSLKPGSPQWMVDAMREAHDGKMPNDQSYAMIENATYAISEALESGNDIDDERRERVDGLVSVYHAERFAWLASNITRADYCDEACSEGMVAKDATLSDRIAAGMFAEYEIIWNALYSAIANESDEEEAD